MFQRIALLIILLFSNTLHAQIATQNIRGKISDPLSQRPIAYASIGIPAINKATFSDSLGNFLLPNIPIGHHDVHIQALGYEPYIAKEILLISGKEYFLNASLRERIATLGEVLVLPQRSKEEALNPQATLSTRTLSVEEAARFAGGFDDPARLVAAFAGVSSNVGNNGISIRGNNPKYLQWKLEGIEIPNPNHFADNASFGAGVLSALSSHSMGPSDFFTGAFPAEYNNALSGVFDMNIRKPNTGKRSRVFSIGLTGIDYAEEGSFRKEGDAAYLFNSRISTLSLLKPILPEDGGKGVDYQDLSFKMIFPTKRAGEFSIFGIGLNDFTGLNPKPDTLQWERLLDRQEHSIRMYMGTIGLKHRARISPNTYLHSTLAATSNGLNFSIDQRNADGTNFSDSRVRHVLSNLILNTYFQKRISKRHQNKTGILITDMRYKLALDKLGTSVVDERGRSLLLNAYSSSSYAISARARIHIGLHAQVFSLNGDWSLEPRLGWKYRRNARHSISMGYGLHSRLEKLNYYFARNTMYADVLPNKNLGFTKAHHFVAGYDWSLSEDLHLKVEPYYQFLFDVPVVAGSSFSFINLTNDWFFNQPLENTGLGENYGIDVSLDRYLRNGFYYSATVSVFNSSYRGGDKIWRNTRFNRNYVLNFLTGKEWVFGSMQHKTFGANVRFSYQGGDRYSPIDLTGSVATESVVFDERDAFSQQLSSSFVTHFTLVYRVNKKQRTTEWALKVLNAGGHEEFYEFVYNYKSRGVEELRRAVVVPNLSWKRSF